jgi:hypothetical protein
MLKRSTRTTRQTAKPKQGTECLVFLSEARAYITSLRFDPDAKRSTCFMPFCGLYWQDENFEDVFRLPLQAKRQIVMIFAIRSQFFAGRRLMREDRQLWNAFMREFPHCPIALRSKRTSEMKELMQGAWQVHDDVFSGWDTEVEAQDDGTQVVRRVRHPKPPSSGPAG